MQSNEYFEHLSVFDFIFKISVINHGTGGGGNYLMKKTEVKISCKCTFKPFTGDLQILSSTYGSMFENYPYQFIFGGNPKPQNQILYVYVSNLTIYQKLF
jgi:hypothetical protein